MFGGIEWLYRVGWQPRGGRGINQGAWQSYMLGFGSESDEYARAFDWWTFCRSEAE